AAHTVTTRWVVGDRNVAVGTTMWREWRRHWSRAAPVSVLATALTVSLAATWWFAGQQAPIPGAVARALSTVGLLLMAALLPHLAWVVERTDLTVARTVLAALAAGLSRPLLTVTLLVIGLGWPTALVLSGWPGLLPVLGVSVPMLAAAWCINRVFPAAEPATPGEGDDTGPASTDSAPHTPETPTRQGTPTVPVPSVSKGTEAP
ncbi:MAG TPA: hypothetical protein VK103_00945, partial [Bacillota bacterium]|nr:hypothetical protein [Bacillota bacterium]